MKSCKSRLAALVMAVVAPTVSAGKAAARFVLEPFRPDAKAMFRRGAWRFLPRPIVLYALQQSDTDKGMKPMPVATGSEVVAVREEISLAANPGVGDILAMLDLPADHVPVDAILDADDLDTNGAPTVTLDVGVLNAAKDNIDVTAASGGGKWITASTVGQAGGLVRPTTKEITRVQASSANRKVGVRVNAASATFAAGKVGLTLMYRAAHFGK